MVPRVRPDEERSEPDLDVLEPVRAEAALVREGLLAALPEAAGAPVPAAALAAMPQTLQYPSSIDPVQPGRVHAVMAFPSSSRRGPAGSSWP